VAAAFAVILASVSLYPIYTGLTWFWAGCGSVIVIALTGTLTRMRRLPVAVVLLAYIVALLLWLNFAFSNAKSLWHLLPTPASLGTLFDIAGQGFNEAAKYAPPVPELRGMVLLAAAGIGITALLTDLIAVRLGSAALAGLPLLLLFTEPFTLSVSRGFFGTTIAFCVSVAGYLALLSSEARDRIREWEHPNPTARDEPDTRTLAAAGRRVGFASVIVALCLPLFIPGLHTTRLFGGQPGIGGNGGGGGSGGGGNGAVGFPDPGSQVSNELRNPRTQLELTYTTTNNSDPAYLPIYTLDQLTDSGWRQSPPDLVSASTSLPKAPGVTASGLSVAKQTTTIKFAPGVITEPHGTLPVPYPATSVKANGTLQADRATLMVFDTGVPFGGLSYQVTSLDEEPSLETLRAAPPPPVSVTGPYLSVPSPYDPLKPLARSITKDAKNPLDDAIALQNYLSDGAFKYTLKAPSVHDAATLTTFLEKTKAGYCEQFSYAMAVLARLINIPARVAYGFTSGSPQSDGSWTVTNHDAHAWPELYFQGYGWLRFEPTPNGSAGPGQGTAWAPNYTRDLAAAPGAGTSQALPVTGPTALPTGQATRVKDLSPLYPGGIAPGAAPKSDALSPWAIFGLVVAGLVVLAAVTPWCARHVIRRRRWRRRGVMVPAGADRVRARDVAWAHAAWEELRDDLVDYGAAPLPSESPRAVAARAGTGLSLAEPARAALSRIAMAEERARYAPAPTDGSSLRADSVAVRRAIAAAVPRDARWRARLIPASVVSPALNAVASAADLYRGSRGGFPQLGRDRSGRQPRGQ
jgi:transglutaminase-like putative cysteine protease